LNNGYEKEIIFVSLLPKSDKSWLLET